MTLLRKLRLRMTGVLVVHLDKALTVFEGRGKKLEIAPVLYVAVGEPQGRVVSVGEPSRDNVATHRVEVFSDEPPPLARISLAQFAEAFFRYAYAKLGMQRAILAPIVVLLPPRKGAVLSPECAQRLADAARLAGASEIYWGPDGFQAYYGMPPNQALERTAA